MEKFGSDKKRFKSQEKELDCTNAARGVWLVKVPKYVSSKWQKAPALSEVGCLKITTLPSGKPDIKFTLTDDINTSQAPDEEPVAIPTEHEFILSNVHSQNLGVFSYSSGETVDPMSDPLPGKVVMEGHVLERGECRPRADQRYMLLKKNAILKAQEPDRRVQQLRRAVQVYKPVNTHKHILEFEQKKKSEGKKAREDKEKVMEMLFAAFEKHQYYNIKDLERVTKQPITYLKEILKEICNYNAKNPHKSMWELKPEYRCYKKPEET